jgi:N-acetylneuraminate synthase
MAESEVKIGAFTIGRTNPPFLVAEMSGNHKQSLKRALAIVEAAGLSGAHAVKLQTYTADSMTLDIDTGEFVISDPDNIWHGESLYRLYQKAATPGNGTARSLSAAVNWAWWLSAPPSMTVRSISSKN